MKTNDEFDSIVNDALAEYRDSEPLSGIEDRIVLRLRMNAVRQRRLFWRLGAIATAVAAVVVMVWIATSVPATQRSSPTAVAQRSSPVVEPSRTPAETNTTHPVSRMSQPTIRASLSRPHRDLTPAERVIYSNTPMRAQFPTPTPLTVNERALLKVAQTHPAALQDLPQDDIDKEIAIAPITITRLAETNDGSEGEN